MNPDAVIIAQRIDDAGLAAVRRLAGAAAVTVVPMFDGESQLEAGLAARCRVLFADGVPANLADLTNLRWLQLSSAGYEHVAGQGLGEHVIVTNASGVNDVPIAEWCLAMMLTFERDMRGLFDMQRRHAWERLPRFQSELRGRRLGIIGYGSIGRTLAQLAAAFGLTISVMTRAPIGPRAGHYAVPGSSDIAGALPERRYTFDEREEFLGQLDYLALTIPIAAGTRSLIGEHELRALPTHAVVLNPSRGRLIDETALLRALTEGWIGGVALDTHFAYPLPPEHPLWDMPNAVLTPHISGSTGSRMFLPRLWELFAHNLAAWMRGDALLNVIAASDLR